MQQFADLVSFLKLTGKFHLHTKHKNKLCSLWLNTQSLYGADCFSFISLHWILLNVFRSSRTFIIFFASTSRNYLGNQFLGFFNIGILWAHIVFWESSGCSFESLVGEIHLVTFCKVLATSYFVASVVRILGVAAKAKYSVSHVRPLR